MLFRSNNSITVGSSTVNTSAIVIGNTTVNASLSSNGVFINGISSGSYYRGNYGAVGSINSKANLFRINSNTQSANIEFLAGENDIGVIRSGRIYNWLKSMADGFFGKQFLVRMAMPVGVRDKIEAYQDQYDPNKIHYNYTP